MWERRGEFETAAGAIVDAYLAAGLSVEAERRHDTFTRLTVSDGVQTAKVELGVDMRANEPVRISIGPVLHPDDAVANKMGALYERALACDFIDIDAVLQSGRYDRQALLQLAERSDITFDQTRVRRRARPGPAARRRRLRTVRPGRRGPRRSASPVRALARGAARHRRTAQVIRWTVECGASGC